MPTLVVQLRWKNMFDTHKDWVWAIMDGHQREAGRLAKQDARGDAEHESLLTYVYGDLIADLIDGSGRQRRMQHLADEFAKQYCPRMSKLIGADVSPVSVGYDADSVLIRLNAAEANRVRDWLLHGNADGHDAFVRLTYRAFQAMLIEETFSAAVWKAASRLKFEHLAKKYREEAFSA